MPERNMTLSWKKEKVSFYIYRMTVVACVLSVSAALIAQDRVRAVSAPGTIGKLPFKRSENIDPSDMVCSLAFWDPGEDGVLVEGETAIIEVSVRNWNENEAIEPKLEIIFLGGDDFIPRMTIEWMGTIAPGAIKSYREYISWDEGLSFSEMTVKIRAFDTTTQYKSDQFSTQFEVAGGGSIPIESR
jgi:hypothetical protein